MVKSPPISPEMKKAKLDVFPDSKRPAISRHIDKADIAKFVDALTSFTEPKTDELVSKSGDQFLRHPNDDIEQYFVVSSQWGVPAISYEIVRPVFIWKLQSVFDEFRRLESEKKIDKMEVEKVEESPVKEKLSITGTKINLIRTIPVPFNVDESIEFIMNKARSFDGFPFTWQRICELITTPMLHYNRLDKFVRAVDKVINVVTTITEWGGRVRGEWEMAEENHVPHLETVFFKAVDEVEEMDQKLAEERLLAEKPIDMSTVNEESNDGMDVSDEEGSGRPPKKIAKLSNEPVIFDSYSPKSPDEANLPPKHDAMEEDAPATQPKDESENSEKSKTISSSE